MGGNIVKGGMVPGDYSRAPADVAECVYCGESVELAADGAWQGVEDGACGCTASLEQGGDGEHDGDGGGACAECGAPVVFHWTGSCPDREVA